MFRRLRWRWAKARFAAPVARVPRGRFWCSLHAHCVTPEAFPPDAEPYEGLAPAWDDWAWVFAPDYGRFLAAAEHHFRQPVRSVLDLACGMGLLSRQIAKRAGTVVGLDASEAMLREARARTADGRVHYVLSDFRDFSLGETFDAAVCGGDSLNYVWTPEELGAVFGCVAGHLRPGGLFAFDVLDHRACLDRAGAAVQATAGHEEVAFFFFYDPDARVAEARVVSEHGVERHRRIPVDEEDVRQAAQGAGLLVAEHFAADRRLLRPARFSAVRQFYLLRKP